MIWLEYKNDADAAGIPKNNKQTLLDFKSCLAEELILVRQPIPLRKRGRPSSSPHNSGANVSHFSPQQLEFRDLLLTAPWI